MRSRPGSVLSHLPSVDHAQPRRKRGCMKLDGEDMEVDQRISSVVGQPRPAGSVVAPPAAVQSGETDARAQATWSGRRTKAGTGATLGLLTVEPTATPLGSAHTTARYLEDAANALRATGVLVQTTVRVGEPATAIVESASDCGAAAIVIATHGRTGLGRAPMGSVADGVLRVSRVPVLLLHPDGHRLAGFKTTKRPIDHLPSSLSGVRCCQAATQRLARGSHGGSAKPRWASGVRPRSRRPAAGRIRWRRRADAILRTATPRAFQRSTYADIYR